MLLVFILTLCYSVSSFDLEKTTNNFKDGNLMKGLLDGQFKINRNGEDTAENLEKFEMNPPADIGFDRFTEVPSKTKRDAATPNSAPPDDLSMEEMHRFCKTVDVNCCCKDCDCASDLPESFSWREHFTTPAPATRTSNSSEELVAHLIAQFVEIQYEWKYIEVAPKLAAQQLTDCAEDWEKYFHWMGAVFRLNIQGGFELEAEYQADTSDSKCRFKEYKKAVIVDTCLQLNFEDEHCFKHYLFKSGPVIVGLRKANLDYNLEYRVQTDCNPVRDEYTPFILTGWITSPQYSWELLSPDGHTFFIPVGIGCQDFGMYALTIPVECVYMGS